MPSFSLDQYRQSAQYFSSEHTDGFQLAYWHHQPEQTPKDTIVFIHGFPSASWDWHYQWQTLAAESGSANQLIAMDMLGFGLSDKPQQHAYQLVAQAQYWLALLQKLQVQRCHIIAHDYGDSVAQELLHLFETQQTTVRLQSVTYLNGGLFSESHRPLFTQKLLLSPLGSIVAKLLSKRSLSTSFHKIFGRQTPPSQHDIDTLWQLLQHNQGTRVMPNLIRYIPERSQRRADWLQAMQQTRVPQLFINGAQDPISGEHMRQRFDVLLPESRTVSLPVGHYPQIEAPDAVLRHFLDFIGA